VRCTDLISEDTESDDMSMTQDELKTLVGRAALDYVPAGCIVGVGTGSTVDKFIDALGEALKTDPQRVRGAVSSSVRSTERLQALVWLCCPRNPLKAWVCTWTAPTKSTTAAT